MFEILALLCVVVSVFGLWLRNHKLRTCFYFFLMSNFLSLAIHLHAGLWQGADVKMMILRDVIFLILAIHGLILWSR